MMMMMPWLLYCSVNCNDVNKTSSRSKPRFSVNTKTPRPTVSRYSSCCRRHLSNHKSCGLMHRLRVFFTRDSMWCFAHLSHRRGVCLSVRPSVCLSHCGIVSKQRKLGSRNLHCDCHKDFNFLWQNFVPLDEGVFLERGSQRGVPRLKRRYFAAIGLSGVKIVADIYRHAIYTYHNTHW